MGFKCSIVGLPNVGKSTLFNCLTNANVKAQNYPFCTIKPNIGMVPVPDSRLKQLADIAKSDKVTPTFIEFVDIAGLVKGASQGEGLGNQFLSHIRETDAILHVIRCFDDGDVIHVNNQLNPQDNMEVIETELICADLETVQKAIIRVNKQAKVNNKDKIKKQVILEHLLHHLDKGLTAYAFKIDDVQASFISTLNLLTLKPMLYVANVNKIEQKNNKYIDIIKKHAKQRNADVITICAKFEAELSKLPNNEKNDMLFELGIKDSGLDRFIHAGYQLLSLHTYFTVGPKEARAWTIPINATASQAAEKIHTDFKKGFIRAEVIAFTDYIKFKGEQGARYAGKWRLEGKEYIVKDGDIIHFRFNV